MGFWTRLWHRLLFGSSPLTAQPRPAARPVPVRPASPHQAASDSAAADIAFTLRQWVKPQPPRCVYRSRQELELAFLLAWVPEDERRRFLDALLPRAGKQAPWTLEDIDDDLWQQCQRWQEPLVIQEAETMSREDLSCLLEGQLKTGCYTYCTPLEVLSRPVRMLWLLRQGRQVGQVYAAMEQALGRAQALDAAWWAINGL
jgi:hypothetical protein